MPLHPDYSQGGSPPPQYDAMYNNGNAHNIPPSMQQGVGTEPDISQFSVFRPQATGIIQSNAPALHFLPPGQHHFLHPPFSPVAITTLDSNVPGSDPYDAEGSDYDPLANDSLMLEGGNGGYNARYHVVFEDKDDNEDNEEDNHRSSEFGGGAANDQDIPKN
ncbi:hypothetical protein M422DRAFT_52731 [Sphaerobolus stellatus SS14]|uniref:Uncharacterized protein n=1 Tax=Sphaerobolus stellatus (strain SS14) TaxID=990650 RepID=A0A0C9V5I1_SPHS4|nr:hypothetical protein M422DRAFT_52731 [Sphaerobolus stellatus SS14]